MEKEKEEKRLLKQRGSKQDVKMQPKLRGYHSPLTLSSDFTTVLTSIREEPLTQVTTPMLNNSEGNSNGAMFDVGSSILKKTKMKLGRSKSHTSKLPELPMLEQAQRSCPSTKHFGYNVKTNINRKMNKKTYNKTESDLYVGPMHMVDTALSLVNSQSLPSPGKRHLNKLARVQSSSVTLEENDLRLSYTP
eukprot:UN07202